jgi:hypothetical protein
MSRAAKLRCFLVLILASILTSPVVAERPDFVLRSRLELQESPSTVGEAGTYRLWVWAEKDKPIRLKLGEKSFSAEPRQGEPFDWVELGQVEAGAKETFAVEFPDESASVGYVALVRGAGDPRRYFAASRVEPRKPGPVDDARLRRWLHPTLW